MISKELIKETVNEEYNKNFSQITELDAFMATIGITEEGLRKMVLYSSGALAWIKQIVKGNKGNITANIKIQIIEEILNRIDNKENKN